MAKKKKGHHKKKLPAKASGATENAETGAATVEATPVVDTEKQEQMDTSAENPPTYTQLKEKPNEADDTDKKEKVVESTVNELAGDSGADTAADIDATPGLADEDVQAETKVEAIEAVGGTEKNRKAFGSPVEKGKSDSEADSTAVTGTTPELGSDDMNAETAMEKSNPTGEVKNEKKTPVEAVETEKKGELAESPPLDEEKGAFEVDTAVVKGSTPEVGGVHFEAENKVEPSKHTEEVNATNTNEAMNEVVAEDVAEVPKEEEANPVGRKDGNGTLTIDSTVRETESTRFHEMTVEPHQESKIEGKIETDESAIETTKIVEAASELVSQDAPVVDEAKVDVGSATAAANNVTPSMEQNEQAVPAGADLKDATVAEDGAIEEDVVETQPQMEEAKQEHTGPEDGDETGNVENLAKAVESMPISEDAWEAAEELKFDKDAETKETELSPKLADLQQPANEEGEEGADLPAAPESKGIPAAKDVEEKTADATLAKKLEFKQQPVELEAESQVTSVANIKRESAQVEAIVMPPISLAKEDESNKEGDTGSQPAETVVGNDGVSTYYTFEELKRGAKAVDFAKREQFLSPDEFKSLFHMTKQEFNGLKKWKQLEAKKKVGLF